MSDKISKEEIRTYLDKGLRNLWYAVSPSFKVHSAPIGVTRLGENLVLWRDDNGVVSCLEDRCPHRGARLSMGWNLGKSVACWYHGVEVNGTGTVTKVPAIDNCTLEGEQCVRAYPTQEHAGAIFVWFGDPDNITPLVLPDEISTDEHEHFLCLAYWDCNYQYAIDNVMDPMHGAYLHSVSHSMAFGDKQGEFRTRKTKTGLIFEKIGQNNVNFDWTEIGITGGVWLKLAIPYRKRYGPGGNFGIVGYATPVDAHGKHMQVYFWRTRKVQGWVRDVWKFFYRNRLEGLHWSVLEQDRVVLETLAPDARDHEFLYEHDIGVSQVRRTLQKLAEKEIQAANAKENQAKEKQEVVL